jgi:hypothetical protein
MAARVTGDTNRTSHAFVGSDKFSSKTRHDLIPPTVSGKQVAQLGFGDLISVLQLD